MWHHKAGPAADSGLQSNSHFRFPSSLSVFFPAYNDAPSLPSLLKRTFETLRRVASDFEVIVVNDGSSDETAAVLDELRTQYAPLLRVVTHERNQGYGAALRSGFAAASKEFIFYTDGDSQYDPAELENLLRLVTPETGLVNGYKIERSDPWHRIAIGWLYNRFARWLFRIEVRDIDCDFRLIRRDALDQAALRSTGGTICIELVRALELSGAGIAEAPVHHYARQYGRSQFFRVRSLVSTFMQLCSVFFRLSLTPALFGTGDAGRDEPTRISARFAVLAAFLVAFLSILAYWRALFIPFMSDDYLQIRLAREYGPISAWPNLAQNALYRCRATSLLLTYWLDRAVGLVPFYYNVASLVLHIADSLLVFGLGLWRPVGWRTAALAACFFALSHRHSEAVVWFAAIPELLVFFFVLTGFLFWVRWLDASGPGSAGARRWFYIGAFGSFVLALLSKESAVVLVPLCALPVFLRPDKPLRKLWGLVPFALLTVAYFGIAYFARASHQHFQDGTFSLSAPFIATLIRSLGGLLWVWGVVFTLVLLTRAGRPWRFVLPLAAAWMVLTLLPYSFLTYMPRVPSRHTYLASVGKSLIVAAGLLALRNLTRGSKKVWVTPCVMAVVVIHQWGYHWTIKYKQYSQRAQPTEGLIQAAKDGPDIIYANCFPYSQTIADSALSLTSGARPHPKLVIGTSIAEDPDSINFCNPNADGIHY